MQLHFLYLNQQHENIFSKNLEHRMISKVTI